jgi:hypothetical protein
MTLGSLGATGDAGDSSLDLNENLERGLLALSAC